MSEEDGGCTAKQAVIIIIDDIKGTLTRDGEVFKLDPIIFRLLAYLKENAEQVITRQQLMENVWQSNHTSDSAINRSISYLRKAFGGPRNSIIKTLSRKGYCFTVPTGMVIKHVDEQTAENVDIINYSDDVNVDGIDLPLNQTSQVQKSYVWHQLLVAAIAIVTILAIFYTIYPTTQTPRTALPTAKIEKNKKPQLFIAPIQITESLATANLLEQTFTSQLSGKIVNSKGIELVNQIPQNSKQFILYCTISELNDELSFNLRIMDHSNEQIIYATVLNFPTEQIQVTLKKSVAEIAAILELFILNANRVEHYIGALNPLSYGEILQLVNISKNVGRRLINYSHNAKLKLYAFNEKYPNTPEILGLLAKVQLNSFIHSKSQFNRANEIINYANQALLLDSINYDALLSLYYFYNRNPHSREKASKYLFNLLRFHSNNPEAWRAKLVDLVISKTPCKDIKQFLHTIPVGVFKLKRLKVINHILSSCMEKLPLDGLLVKNHHSKNDFDYTAVVRNLNLFDIKNDEYIAVIDELLTMRSDSKLATLRKLNGLFLIGDYNKAKTFTNKIKTNKSFGASMADLVMVLNSFYLPSQHISSQTLDNLLKEQPYGHSTLVLISYLINRKIDNTQADNLFMFDNELLVPFDMNLTTIDDSIALIVAQHHQGSTEQSAINAQRLFWQLERYRQDDAASFYFWRLGRYHLITRFYCGQTCKTLNDEEYLNKVFAPNHTWWADDLILMQNILAVWHDSALIQSYLDKVEQDRIRIGKAKGWL